MDVGKQVGVAPIESEVLCSLNPAIEREAVQGPDSLVVAALTGQFHCVVLGVVPGDKNSVSQFRSAGKQLSRWN